ncbi:MAG TPA: XrtA/PEP-CTERM system histidine kinase PrsK, partial [Stellaceae bacterium]|nr:XrtA/PEP-CTERM system histidine kinase PrsK [Stellaceae bacterium]
AAIMLLLVPLSSGSVRAYLRILVEKNFFQLKYDYRTEWLRFIKTISPSDLNESLETRVIEAIGNIVESPDGDLWLQREQGQYRLAGSWNASRWEGGGQDAVLDAASPLASFLVRTQWIVNVDEFAAAPSRYQGLEQLPKWLLANGRAWLVLPLLHRDSLLGFVVLGKPRVPRELIWEDFDLIKTVTRQAASYLAEQAAYEALTEARQFELFNKRFAFVVHDIKNLVSQLSLILSNSVRHRGNLEFQNDLLETIGGSVEKMKRMLRQLQAEPEHGSAARAVALAPLLRKVVATQNEVGFKVSLDLRVDEIAVATDEDRLKAVVEHLVQNAVEAVGRRGRVQVRLAGEGGMAVVEIEDDGPGMEPEFVREQLFRPFATTKSQGFGIGVYESRDFAQALGGGLDVSSEPGKGTIMRMRLPATARP